MSRLELAAPARRLLVPVLAAVLLLPFLVGSLNHAPPELGPATAAALEEEGADPGPPIAGEIARVFRTRDAQLQELKRLHEETTGLEARLALERKMADVKRRAVLEMFRIQRRYAIERDDAATVDLMDAAIRRIEHRLAKGAVLPPEDVPTLEAAPAGEVKP